MFSETVRKFWYRYMGITYDRTYALWKLYLPRKLIDMAIAGVHATMAPEDIEKMRKSWCRNELSHAPNPGTLDGTIPEK